MKYSDDYWYETMRGNFVEDLKLKQFPRYLACFMKTKDRIPLVIVVTYVDDPISTGDQIFEEESKEI